MNCRRKKLRLEERKRRNSMLILTLEREGQEKFLFFTLVTVITGAKYQIECRS